MEQVQVQVRRPLQWGLELECSCERDRTGVVFLRARILLLSARSGLETGITESFSLLVLMEIGTQLAAVQDTLNAS